MQDEDQEEMKELDETRQSHKRSVIRRAAKLAAQNADPAAAQQTAEKVNGGDRPILIPQNALLKK